VTVAPPPVDTAVIHYQRPDGDYAAWGLHLWGDGLQPGEATAEWANPTPFESTDAYGAVHTIRIADDTKPVGFIVHRRPPGDVNEKDTGADRFFTPIEHREIWLRAGDPTVYSSPPSG
jgi:hypothetical protein